MQLRLIAITAATVVTIILLIGAAKILDEISRIENELDVEIDAFKAEANILWKEMIKMGANRRAKRNVEANSGAEGTNKPPKESETPSMPDSAYLPSVSTYLDGLQDTAEKENDVQESTNIPEEPEEPGNEFVPQQCTCDYDFKCPPGPPGPKGPPGPDGPDGEDGQDGMDGADSEDVPAQIQSSDTCFTCPAGPIGPPGPQGSPGPRGMRGARGTSGTPGRDGQPGFPGHMGPTGPPGPRGEDGPQGPPGENAEHIVGRKGKKGETGEQGPPGDPGDPGNPGREGLPGPVGERGPEGPRGESGRMGEPGPEGEEGEPGNDAQYCPCPRRNYAALAAELNKLAAAEGEQYLDYPQKFLKRPVTT